jgi:regulatory protein
MIRFDIDRSEWARRGGDLAEVGDGARVPFGALQGLAERSQTTFVVADAGAYLARREHSEQELRRKLRRKGYTSEACAYALEKLRRRGSQSDRRFAEEWVRGRMRGKGVSRTSLLSGLQVRGVERGEAETVVSAYERDHPGCFAAALAHHAQGERPATNEERQRVIARLVRKGFPYGEVKAFFA